MNSVPGDLKSITVTQVLVHYDKVESVSVSARTTLCRAHVSALGGFPLTESLTRVLAEGPHSVRRGKCSWSGLLSAAQSGASI